LAIARETPPRISIAPQSGTRGLTFRPGNDSNSSERLRAGTNFEHETWGGSIICLLRIIDLETPDHGRVPNPIRPAMSARMKPSRDVARLIEIMARLRTPGAGCPWDLEQSFATVAPYTIEEAYEVADAIERNDRAALKDELGDLLLQVAFHARMAEEEHSFDFGDVVLGLTEKLVRRHPHVFGDAKALAPNQVKTLWERIKDEERKVNDRTGAGLLDVPHALPALTRALKLQRKAASVGFDWKHDADVRAKIDEELSELQAAAGEHAKEAEEIGDLLFAVVNLARRLGVDPEEALRAANRKFERRFRAIETALAARGHKLGEVTLDELDALWNEAKAKERD
jgi:ATP diphosphatase